MAAIFYAEPRRMLVNKISNSCRDLHLPVPLIKMLKCPEIMAMISASLPYHVESKRGGILAGPRSTIRDNTQVGGEKMSQYRPVLPVFS